MREPTGPHDLVRRGQLQHLFHNTGLTFGAEKREDLAKVEEDVGIYGGKVPSFPSVWVTRMEEDDLGVGISLD